MMANMELANKAREVIKKYDDTFAKYMNKEITKEEMDKEERYFKETFHELMNLI